MRINRNQTYQQFVKWVLVSLTGKSLMLEYEIQGSILAYTKNLLMFLSGDKNLLSRANAIG